MRIATPSVHPASTDNPIAMENKLAAEAKTLSLLTKPGSADALM
jgi:hypothetical protein